MSVRIIKIKWSTFIKYTEKDTVKIPTDPGVYEYYSESKKSKTKNRKYLGKADNLLSRFNQHLSKDEENECLKKFLKDYVWFYRYAIIQIKADREDAELGLYRKYSYDCNKVEPPGSGKGTFKIEES